MANEKQLAKLKKGTKVWNTWREKNLDARIDLREAKLKEANLQYADLRRADLRGTILDGANLSETTLYGANLSGAVLREANLIRADLTRANFTRAKLIAANLKEAKLVEADLNSAILTEANLMAANLSGAQLGQTNLSGAFLRYVDLTYASLTEADLSRADLKKTEIGFTKFAAINLSNTNGLEEVVHHSASYVSTDTLHHSEGKIPKIFLRGCGLSDLDIEYAKLAAPDLDSGKVTDITYKIHELYLGGGIQYYSCFISYNSKDQEFAKPLHDDLQNNGVRCWFAPEDMKIGDQIRPRVDQEIRIRDKLLVILSENSVKSEWVGDEVEAALEEESKNNRLVLFPIRLDDAVMNTRDDWAAKIKRRRHIGDFSNWKDKASYQKAFERLLRDLKATGG